MLFKEFLRELLKKKKEISPEKKNNNNLTRISNVRST